MCYPFLPPLYFSFYPRHPRGWRPKSFLLASSCLEFLSTPPSRVATTLYLHLSTTFKVSIHATLAGGDKLRRIISRTNACFYPRHPRGWRLEYPKEPLSRESVSIHATLAGGDIEQLNYEIIPERFYPRHPRGWRQRFPRNEVEAYAFLSTPPSRVATLRVWRCPAPSCRFYPRHPRGWRLSQQRKNVNNFLCFYPRHPRGWRRLIVNADFYK